MSNGNDEYGDPRLESGNGNDGGEEWTPPVSRYEPLLNIQTGEWVYAGYNRRDRTIIPIDPNTGAPIFGGQFATQDRVLLVLNERGEISRQRTLTQSEAAALGLGVGTTGGGGGGGGGGGTLAATRNYAAEQAAEQAHERWMLEQQLAAEEELQRERLLAEAEEAEKTRLAQYKLQRIGEITSLLGDWFTRRQDYQQWLAETAGRDPIRAAIAGGGGVQRGTTPMQSVRGEMQQFLAQPTPQVRIGYDVTPEDLDIQTRYLRAGLRLPRLPSFGLAYGGILDMELQADGSYAVASRGGVQNVPAGSGILVGEGEGGEGIRAGTAEVLRFNPDNTIEIIPLTGAAQGGGAFRTMDPDQALSIRQAFAPVYGSMGFSDIPSFRRTIFGTMRPEGYGAAQGLQRLGYQPRLFQLRGRPNLYYLDPSGELMGMSQDVFREAGFRPQDVFDVSMQDLATLTGPQRTWEEGGLRQLTEPPPLIEGPAQPYGRYAMPLTIPGLNIFLPGVEQALGAYRQSNPALREQMLRAWELAGLTMPQIEGRMGFFTPTGTGGGGVGWR